MNLLLSAAGLALITSGRIACATSTWPGSQRVEIADETDEFGENLSGLVYDSNITDPDNTILWAVQNNPSTLYKLLWNEKNGIWLPDTKNKWDYGKSLKWMDGKGNPDSEDLVIPAVIESQMVDGGNHKSNRASGSTSGLGSMAASLNDLYVCTERNDEGDESNISRMSILRFKTNDLLDLSDSGTNSISEPLTKKSSRHRKLKKSMKSQNEPKASLTAVQEWRLNDHLPVAGYNLGLEAITWIPGEHLQEQGFIDTNTGNVYDPSVYPDAIPGVFVVGLEVNGVAYLFVLNKSDDSSVLIGSFSPNNEYIMSLAYDATTRYLWSLCDNSCATVTHTILSIKNGNFQEIGSFAAPSAVNEMNIEGYAMVPESMCVNDETTISTTDAYSKSSSVGLVKTVYWADDSNDNGHSVRQGTMPCGQFVV